MIPINKIMSTKSENVDSGSGAIDNTINDADEFDFEPVAAPLVKIKTRSKRKQTNYIAAIITFKTPNK